ncbi:MAG: glycosyltransferase family 4 protein [Cyclobacteriaceae bacterium]
MEIIHLILGKANPARMNGVNKVVYQLATHQALHGRSVQIWGITDTPEDQNFGERNFKTRLFKASSNPFGIHQSLRKALYENRKRIVVHLHGGWIPRYATLVRLLVRWKIPYVITPHGAYNTEAMKRSFLLKRIYFQLAERYVLRHASRIHCIGASEVDGLNSIFKASNVSLLPYGFTPGEVSTKKSDHRSRMVIGFVGRLDVYTKGLDLLLDALAAISDMDIEVWIIGDGPERARFESMIRNRNLEHIVVCQGSKFGSEKEEWMSKMNVFVHPSRNEGLPSAVLEAASLGIPCLISEATNLGSFVRTFNAGFVIKTNDADELQSALEKISTLHAERLLPALGENARRMVEKAFNWKTVVNNFDSLYQYDSHVSAV